MLYLSSPVINGKVEERICGYGPVLLFLIEQDDFLASRIEDIFMVINDNFAAVNVYLLRLTPILIFFNEDSLVDTEVIRNERGNRNNKTDL